MNRVLVTGGAGFIGHRVVALLAARGQQVAVVDNLSVGMPMPPKSDFVTSYETDIRDAGALYSILTDFAPEAIIHLAALHHIPTCERQPELAKEINITGTATLLHAAATHAIKKLVLASSAAIYDWQETALVEDATPLRATDIYSTCKLANEEQARLWAKETDARVALARIFNVIGHDDPNGHLIPDILQQITLHSSTIRLGNTAPRRDYTHADDTARGIIALLDCLPHSAPVEAYNICSGREYSVTDLVEAIGEYLGLNLIITHDPNRVRTIDRLHLLGDPAKTKRLTGWQATLPFHTALARILAQLMPGAARARVAG